MGMFDFLKSKKKVEEKKVEEKKVEEKKVEEKKDEVEKNSQKFYLPSEVSIIIRPRTTSDRFEDLNGTYVGKVSSSKKHYCRENGHYLGLKEFKKTQRWVLINSEDVKPFLENKDFINDHKYIDPKVIRLEKFKKYQNNILKE